MCVSYKIPFHPRSTTFVKPLARLSNVHLSELVFAVIICASFALSKPRALRKGDFAGEREGRCFPISCRITDSFRPNDPDDVRMNKTERRQRRFRASWTDFPAGLPKFTRKSGNRSPGGKQDAHDYRRVVFRVIVARPGTLSCPRISRERRAIKTEIADGDRIDVVT